MSMSRKDFEGDIREGAAERARMYAEQILEGVAPVTPDDQRSRAHTLALAIDAAEDRLRDALAAADDAANELVRLRRAITAMREATTGQEAER